MFARGGITGSTCLLTTVAAAYANPDVPRLSEEAEKALDTRFWYTSAATVGMESDVWLSWESRVRVEDVQIVTSVREREIRVGLTVRNDAEEAFHGDIRLRVRRAGETELELEGCNLDLAPGESRRLETATPWGDAVLWGRPPYGERFCTFSKVRCNRQVAPCILL